MPVKDYLHENWGEYNIEVNKNLTNYNRQQARFCRRQSALPYDKYQDNEPI
jgi:hypothetical protein